MLTERDEAEKLLYIVERALLPLADNDNNIGFASKVHKWVELQKGWFRIMPPDDSPKAVVMRSLKRYAKSDKRWFVALDAVKAELAVEQSMSDDIDWLKNAVDAIEQTMIALANEDDDDDLKKDVYDFTLNFRDAVCKHPGSDVNFKWVLKRIVRLCMQDVRWLDGLNLLVR